MSVEQVSKNFAAYSKDYEWKSTIDAACKKNMDAYTADVFNSTYLPQYSAREPEQDYNDRLTRAKNGYLNFPEKIVEIYQNSIYRSGDPTREGNSDEFKRFIKNVDGAGTPIGQFIKEQVFVYNEVHGGCFIVVDKPQRPDTDTLTKLQQKQLGFYPYCYIYSWENVTNFAVDRHKNLDWILFNETYSEDGSQKTRYRYFDKNEWAILGPQGGIKSQGVHGLGVVPVIRSFGKRNAGHQFLTPKSPLDDVIRLSLKIYEYQSQLEQMIVAHVFMKLAMPEGMWKLFEKSGGNFNVFVFPDGTEEKAYYIESQMSEIDKMIDLVYDKMPNKVLYFATLRDKVEMPREESGVAKFVDSSDEISNLLNKANQMEWVENEMVKLDLLWEDTKDEDAKIVYEKVFDVKSTYEQIEEVVKIFKEDLGSPTFNRAITKRLMINMLGHVSDKQKAEIEKDLEYAIDPSLSIDDVDKLAHAGILKGIALVKKYNPDMRDKSDDDIKAFIAENLASIMGISTEATDSSLAVVDGASGQPKVFAGIQIQAANDIIQAVSSGEIPRDSGINQLVTFLGLTQEQAEKLMGDAGTGKRVKPNTPAGGGNAQ